MHRPRGRGWRPIREAGRKPGYVPTPTGRFREQSSYEQTTNARLSRRHDRPAKVGCHGRRLPPAHAGPKWERLWGPADLLPTGHSPTSNPADSATLRLPNTSIRNVVTPLGLSVGSIA